MEIRHKTVREEEKRRQETREEEENLDRKEMTSVAERSVADYLRWRQENVQYLLEANSCERPSREKSAKRRRRDVCVRGVGGETEKERKR